MNDLRRAQLDKIQASITDEKSAAKALAAWLRSDRSPDDDEAYTELVLIAANTLAVQSEENAAAEDDIQAFCDEIHRLRCEEAILSLIRDAAILATVIDGKIAVKCFDDEKAA